MPMNNPGGYLPQFAAQYFPPPPPQVPQPNLGMAGVAQMQQMQPMSFPQMAQPTPAVQNMPQPGAGGPMAAMQALAQNPQFLQMLMGAGQQNPQQQMLQPPGLLMPSTQGSQFQMPEVMPLDMSLFR